MPPIIDKEKCTGCAMCAKICPTDAIHVETGEKIPRVTYPEECWHCNACVLDCKPGAIKLRIPLPAMMLYINANR